jgi:hypothetical protein
MLLDRLDADIETVRDLCVRQSIGHERDDIALPRCERLVGFGAVTIRRQSGTSHELHAGADAERCEDP